MTVLQCLEWVLESQNIVTCVVLLMFVFGCFFKLIGLGGR